MERHPIPPIKKNIMVRNLGTDREKERNMG